MHAIISYFSLTQVDPKNQHNKGGGFGVGTTVGEFLDVTVLSLGHVLRFRFADPKEALVMCSV